MNLGDRVAVAHPKAMGRTGYVVARLITQMVDPDGDVVAEAPPRFVVQADHKSWCWRHWRMHTPVYVGLSADQLVPAAK